MAMTRQSQRVPEIDLRPFEEKDYESVVAIANAIFPDRPGTVEEWRYDDEHFDRTKYVQERYVAVKPDAGVVGFAQFEHIPWIFHPRKFGARIRVHPHHQWQGIGTRLWAWEEESLRRHQAIAVRTGLRETMTEGLRFVKRLGFHEVMRMWEARLDVASCDLERFCPHVDQVAASGVRITTLAAERERDSRCLERLYELSTEIGKDIPLPDRFTPVDFRMFVEYALESPRAIPEACFIAIAGDDYAGYSNLFQPKVGDWLNQGTTGVRRAYRGRGIATALKVKTVEYAKARGIREIRTENEVNNTGIVAINDRFGFVRQPGWITFLKEF